MIKPYRNTKNDMTFEKAERAAWGKEKELTNFFKNAERLGERGYEDEAFYFEQVYDHLRDGGSLSDDVGRILGL